jgi:hypothetical protein
VRFVLGVDQAYPCTLPCKHGWTWDFPDFEAHLALLFSHECYHFAAHVWPARFPGQDWQDEQAANAWALKRCTRLGYSVQAEPPEHRGDSP